MGGEWGEWGGGGGGGGGGAKITELSIHITTKKSCVLPVLA